MRVAPNEQLKNCVVSPHPYVLHNEIMSFAILRVQKLKSLISINRSLKHAFREQETPNADPNKTQQNTHLGASSSNEAMNKVKERLPEKKRKNAVLAIEYLITASPEAMHAKTRAQQDAYFNEALTWLKARHQDKNVIYAGIHRDESTPHMYAYVVPIDSKGRLNCRSFLGGAKALSDMQTEFALTVGKPHGLERGIKGSKAHHTPVKQYYARVNAGVPKPMPLKVPEPNFTDRLKLSEYGNRVAESVIEQLKPSWNAMSARSAELDVLRSKMAERDATLKGLQDKFDDFIQEIQSISKQGGRKQALDVLKAINVRLSEQKSQEKRRLEEHLQLMAKNMQQANPQLTDKQARSQAESMLTSDHPDAQKWLRYRPENRTATNEHQQSPRNDGRDSDWHQAPDR